MIVLIVRYVLLLYLLELNLTMWLACFVAAQYPAFSERYLQTRLLPRRLISSIVCLRASYGGNLRWRIEVNFDLLANVSLIGSWVVVKRSIRSGITTNTGMEHMNRRGLKMENQPMRRRLGSRSSWTLLFYVDWSQSAQWCWCYGVHMFKSKGSSVVSCVQWCPLSIIRKLKLRIFPLHFEYHLATQSFSIRFTACSELTLFSFAMKVCLTLTLRNSNESCALLKTRRHSSCRHRLKLATLQNEDRGSTTRADRHHSRSHSASYFTSPLFPASSPQLTISYADGTARVSIQCSVEEGMTVASRQRLLLKAQLKRAFTTLSLVKKIYINSFVMAFSIIGTFLSTLYQCRWQNDLLNKVENICVRRVRHYDW